MILLTIEHILDLLLTVRNANTGTPVSFNSHCYASISESAAHKYLIKRYTAKEQIHLSIVLTSVFTTRAVVVTMVLPRPPSFHD